MSPTTCPLPAGASTSAAPRCVPAPSTLRVGLMGQGVVGRGVTELVAAKGDEIARRHGVRVRIDTVLVRDATKPRAAPAGGARLTDDAAEFFARGHDVVVEVLGGVEPAASLVAQALRSGTPVVTANKALLAARGRELAALAASRGVSLRFEASVAAGIPLFALLERSLRTTRVARIEAILNGTSNFVVSRLGDVATSVDDALVQARRLGFAEADATLDVNGADAAQKLRVLSLALAGRELATSRIDVRGIASLRPEDLRRAAAAGLRIRPVACASLGAEPRGWVGAAAVETAHPLASVEDAHNGVRLLGDTLEELFLAGPGAGPVPTAASIVDDLVAEALRLPAAPLVRSDDAPPAGGSAAPDRPSWLVAAGAVPGGPTLDTIARFLTDARIELRERREIAERSGPVLVARTGSADAAHVARVETSLRTVGAVREWTAFRVLERR